MSIANEITRLQTAKADIKAAIEGKGVAVGDGTIDTYAEKISEISSGASGTYFQIIEVGDQIGQSDFAYPENEVVLPDVTHFLATGYIMSDGAPVYSVTYGPYGIITYGYIKTTTF